MCPEPGLISAFVDGEVPSPWKERLAAHLAACPACAARARSYGGLKEALLSPNARDAGAEAAILARLESRLAGRLGAQATAPEASAPSTQAVAGPGGPQVHGGLWSRRLFVPMPVAMAAAAALVFLAGLAFSGIVRPVRPSVQTLATNQIVPGLAQPASMEALVSYLESQDAKVNLTIQLPSDALLEASGKPQVVRAADANYVAAPGTDGQ